MVKIKRVAMLLDNPLNPDPRVWRSAITLQKNGYDVTIFCQKEEGLSEYEEIEGVKIKRVFQYKLGTSVLVDKYLQAHFQLKEALNKEERFDIFHCHDTETWPLGYIVAKEQNAKWIADSHEYFPDYLPKNNYTDQRKYETSKMLILNRGEYIRYADAVITVCKPIAEVLKQEYNLTCPIGVIYNTRYHSVHSNINTSELRAKLNIDENDKILVYAGYLHADRGIRRLVEIIHHLPLEFKLLIMGSGYEEEFLREVTKTSNQVIYLGFLPYQKMVDYIEIADALLHFPDIGNGNGAQNTLYAMPNKFFDAIFSNTPFYTYSQMESIAEYLKRFGIGKGFDLNMSIEEIAKYIVENNEKYLLKGSFAKAQEYFSWGDQARKLKEIYEKLEGK